jgi:hypothetical protein
VDWANVARRRNISRYRAIPQDDIELLVSFDLASQSQRLSIDLKRFWFFRNLKAVAESSSGPALGRGKGS